VHDKAGYAWDHRWCRALLTAVPVSLQSQKKSPQPAADYVDANAQTARMQRQMQQSRRETRQQGRQQRCSGQSGIVAPQPIN
jgi:hypothetical protein